MQAKDIDAVAGELRTVEQEFLLALGARALVRGEEPVDQSDVDKIFA